ncbi:hypothetical protein ABB37_03202 [Leptomonas pyrrhocoris]|uniref:Nucleoside phosphorylase domain-containing protein n=1 Tax=Leptomonas pyrrhocoris TaxID=157538 RepID=A0A0M9G4M2_LEPPY|nr:hypothetical protein ABB37_03202 [Leptomonas pyrrhocoris]KPA82029.1 hypothetical protein ABB37_03202 [Leptomonas pyrrhocoris]|eukprot:XP_015660468.1 hypothetical protein ABB37_03202 [Leptomonas pyrrhocoris]
MLPQNFFNAAFVLVLAYLLFAYTNRGGIDLPRPLDGYYFVPNETQKLLAEANKEAARVLAVREAKQSQLGAVAASAALTRYGVALKDGDEALEATIHYVHQYRQLATGAETLRRREAPNRNKKHTDAASPADVDGQSPVPVQVFLAADNGTYSGMHELYFIQAAMRYSTPFEIDGCRSATFGFLEKPHRDALTWSVQNQQRGANEDASKGLRHIPVLAVTTGIYVTSSAACTAAVMELPMFHVQSVTLIGTSGASPVVGGGGWNAQVPPAHRAVSSEKNEKDTNPTCQQQWAPDAEKVALGSVCVTYGSLLQECGHCVEENELTSLCARPRCTMHNSTTFFGPCSFRHPTSSFAEQMKGAMYRRPFPTPPTIVKEAMQAFWEVNEAVPEYVLSTEESGTAKLNASEMILSYNRVPPKTPILLNCAEVVTSQILAGPRSDILCRQYTEELFEGLYPAKELSCVQSMEGVGVLHVLTREYPHVPVAIVRGVSNYDMFPLSRHVHLLNRTTNANQVARDEWYVSWDQKEHYMSDDKFHDFTKASYRYSIETASAVVLNYFLSAETGLPGMV